MSQLTMIPRSIKSNAILYGVGNASDPFVENSVDRNFFAHWLKSAAATGTIRGQYLRLYLTGGAGGEAIRAYTTVSSNAPADTVNGGHLSLDFGTSVGNITGLGTAARCTLHVPHRNLTGTTAAVQVELYADGTNSNFTGVGSFIRAVIDGDSTGMGKIEDTCYFATLAGGSNASGNVVGAAGNEPTWTSKTYLIRCLINGTIVYLVGVSL